MSWLVVLGFFVVLIVAALQYLVWYQRWEARNTRGMAYYRASVAAQEA